MKKNIHPKYNECNVKCVCGNAFTTKSTLTNISVEVCGACHPVYTGKQKIVDSTGRVERFQKMAQKRSVKVRSKAEKRIKKSEKKIESKSKIENNTLEKKEK
ncbi:MAG: 50S ribosomal protein L31 [Candidatus Pacebacteria bacterium]|nr:50S ribosomal protein L31 [Candidatus Paceibacterota bacterium]